MIKSLSKPMSSPGREKFPPPLLRFLRTNVGSRSRGRSRSSPMFSYLRSTRKTTNSNAVLETTQEPSSPKVTCIGQVRVRRSKKSTTAAAAVKVKDRRKRCCSCWFTTVRVKKRVVPFKGWFRKWGSFFRFGYCKKVDDVAEEDGGFADQNRKVERGKIGSFCNNNKDNTSSCSFGSETSTEVVYGNNTNNDTTQDDCKRRASVDSSCLVSSSTSTGSPPKNALLLTRCRSAPYRSSSLRGRFWIEDEFQNLEAKSQQLEEEELQVDKEEKPRISEEKPRISDTACVDEQARTKDQSSVDSAEYEEKSSKELLEEETENKSALAADEEERKGVAVVEEVQQQQHPLLLTRCKSEPATTGERLVVVGVNSQGHNSKTSFWKQRRLGNAVVEPCSSAHTTSS